LKRRQFLQSAAALTTGSLGLGMGLGQVFAQETGRMVFLTPQGFSLAFSAIMYGQSGGYFAEEGLDVHVEGGRGAAQTIQLVAAQQVDVSRTGGANYMIARVEQSAPVVAIATIAQTSPFFMISPEAAPIVDPQDYVGRTLGMASLGGSMEATLDLMLRRNGIDPAEVRRERIADTPAGYGMIEAGRLDGFFGNVSTATRLQAEGLPITIEPLRDGIPGQVYVVNDDTLTNRADELTAFMRGAYRAIQDMVERGDDLGPVIESMRSQFDIPGSDDTEVAIADLKGNRDLWVANGAENALRNDPEQWDEGEALLRAAGSLQSETELDLYTNAIWDAANAG
jgi:ABC-type nitrate/sulfonate/bicarbonate transport system substrate-binding protein